MKNIIIHYHIFKNAGTTIDEILRSSFGTRWQNLDKLPTPGVKIFPFEIQNFLEHNPQICALSSHDAVLPEPVGEFRIFPIFFLRHPLLRAQSAWKFEWQIQLGLTSPKGSFSEFIQHKIDRKEAGVFSNFQTHKLSNQAYKPIDLQRRPATDGELLQIAQTVLDTTPFFGLVEHMQESLERMHFYLKMAFPELLVFNKRLNASASQALDTSIALEQLRMEIGDALYKELEARNTLDLKLYQYAADRFFSVVSYR